MPDLKAIFSNLGAPMPLRCKVQRLLVNNWTKLRNRSKCCGHPGEPGCWEIEPGLGAKLTQPENPPH